MNTHTMYQGERILNDSEVIRVGGRLRHSDLPYAARHESLFPARHHFFQSWVMALHVKYLHTGPTLVLSVIRRSH